MSKLLVTFPGKFGDLLWALPTVRALSEAAGEPVDLVIAGAFERIVPLLQAQPYLGAVEALRSWEVQDTAPMTPRTPVSLTDRGYDYVLHLGYEGWPSPTLPEDVYQRAARAIQTLSWPDVGRLPALDLDRPWMRANPAWGTPTAQDLAIGFTDEHFELKAGHYWTLVKRVGEAPPPFSFVNLSNSPRWNDEVGTGEFAWLSAAWWLSNTRVFLGDCSALHVLATAMGVPAVVMEPNPHRHHAIFWPCGTFGEHGITLVRGNDGQPTVDARHTWDAVLAALTAREVEVVP